MNYPIASIRDIASSHLNSLFGLLAKVEVSHIERVYSHLNVARSKGANIYVAGNGGSAATAAHWVNDLNKATKSPKRRSVCAMNLSDNIPWLTAIANDKGYKYVFSEQLDNFAQFGDVLIVISASGNSPNLLQAVEFAKERRIITVGLLGFDGGLLKDLVDHYIWVATDRGEYQLVEACHMIICDILTLCFISDCHSSD